MICYSFYCFSVLPESILWLISKGRLEEAETVLRSAVKVNNKELPSDITAILQEVSKCHSDAAEAVNVIDIGVDNPAMSAADPHSLSASDISTSVGKDRKKMADRDLQLTVTPEITLSPNRGLAKYDGDVTEKSCIPVAEEKPRKPKKESTVISMFKEPKIRTYSIVIFYLL